ncbi:MAG TPA: amino acid adenylation domain-containing protein, partial [Blastocatellia bacterium]
MNVMNIRQMFESAAESYPGAPAIAGGKRIIQYGDLEERANNLANFLVGFGVTAGSVIPILAHDPFLVIVSILGVLKAGCIFVPLDPKVPDRRLHDLLELIDPRCCLTEPPLIERLSNLLRDAEPPVSVVYPFQTGQPLGGGSSLQTLNEYAHYWNPRRPPDGLGPDDACYIYFTSGSSGVPKAITGRLRGIDHFIRWEIETLEIGLDTNVSQLLPFSFDGSLRDIFTPLCSGGTVRVRDDPDIILDGARLARWIREAGITVIHCVPSVFRSLIAEDLAQDSFPSLRYILMAGEPVIPADVKAWFDVFEDRVKLVNLYGTSETTMAKFFHFIGPEDAQRPRIPIGKPMPGARAIVVDDDLVPCPPGTVGEILIRTPYRSLGYFRQPELTSEVFIENPFSNDPGDLVHRTGDLGRVTADGNFEYLGRKDRQVKIRGIRVETAEIEGLLRRHPCVADSAVVALDDNRGGSFLAAYVVTTTGTSPDTLHDFLIEYLPENIVPSVFMRLDELPRTLTGKVDIAALPSVSQHRSRLDSGFERPVTPIEEVIAGTFANLLGVSPVGRHDNFFRLGGHSLLATQAASRIRRALGIDLPVRNIFEFPTVIQLAQSVESLRGERLVFGQISRSYSGKHPPRRPLSFAQQRLWFLDQLEPGKSAYNLPLALEIDGLLNVARLEQTLTEIVRRHEILRTTFHLYGGEPVQIALQPRPVSIEFADLSGIAEAEAAAEARRLVLDSSSRPFDLDQGPLMRVLLVKVSTGLQMASIIMHHIISDGWSNSVLIKEVGAIYDAFSEGGRSSLPELSIQYGDFAVWQRQYLSGQVLEQAISHWTERLAGAPTRLDLPYDQRRPAASAFAVNAHSFYLSKETSDSLRSFSEKEGATLFMTLLSIFTVLLYRYSGQQDIVIGSPVAGRNKLETEQLIGLFVNLVALRIDLSGNPSFIEVVHRTRDACLEAYTHQDVPFEKIVEGLKVKPELGVHPVFQVEFNFHNEPNTRLRIGGHSFRGIATHKNETAQDLILGIWDTPEGIQGSFFYNSEIFEPGTISVMAERLTLLANDISADFEASVLRLAPDAGLIRTPNANTGEGQNDASEMYRRSNMAMAQLFFWLEQRTRPDEAL